MTYLLAFAAYLLFVLLKALQQRQVMAAEYRKMPPLSFGMAFCEIFLISTVARTGDTIELILLALCIGAGGAIGSIVGTWLHARKR